MIYLVRYAEIALKGSNRSEFENKLVANIKASLKFDGIKGQVRRSNGRILLDSEKEADVRKVFGIASFSPCIQIKAELQVMCSESLKLAEQYRKAHKTQTFKISSRRLTKDLPLSSVELNAKIGAFIAEKTGLKVDLGSPELDMGVEIDGKDAFLFTKTISCFGGLPVGIEGKLLAVITDVKSALAALLMMKRGCSIELAGLAQAVPEHILSLLQAYSPNKLAFQRMKDYSEIDEVAKKLDCKAAVVGDNLRNLRDYPNNILILRPLIAFSEEEIDAELAKFNEARS